MHIGVFDALNKVLLQKLSGDASKKHYFSAGFLGFFICIQNPYFLVLAFLFVGFEFQCFFLFLLLLFVSEIKLLCCGFCFLLYWVSLFFF